MRRSIAFAIALASIAAVPSAGARPLADMIAPAVACPGANDASAPSGAQERAMLCLTTFARRHDGKSGLADDLALDRSASHKSRDILHCDSFSHYACGRSVTYWMQRVGYMRARCWRAGENIAWGTGAHGSAQSIFRAWLHSPEHRRNILGAYAQIGIGLTVGGLGGRPGVHIWTQHFGSHCRRPRAPVRRGLAEARAVSP
jgi:uncharacterized protein YkwD